MLLLTAYPAGAQEWTLRDLSGDGRAIAWPGDFDGDGDVDLLLDGAWVRNDGGVPRFERPTATRLADQSDTSFSDALAEVHAVADFDGDGVDDLVWADPAVWFRPSPVTDPAAPRPLPPLVGGVSGLLPLDVDGDGDTDLVASLYGDEPAWVFANDGAGGFSAPTPALAEGGSVYGPPADVDGDGDLDAMWTDASGRGERAWVEVTPGGLVLHPIGAGDLAAGRLVDLDGDGDVDLSATDRRGGASAWVAFDNDGTGTFSAPRDLGVAVPQDADVALADLDGDGDDDAVWESLYAVAGDLEWAEGDGAGGFVPRGVALAGPSAFQLVDLDLDGVAEVLDLGEPLTHVTDVLGVPTRRRLEGRAPSGPLAAAADLDGDGRAELVAEGPGDSGWLASTEVFRRVGPGRSTGLPWGTPWFLDLDGDLDLDALIETNTGWVYPEAPAVEAWTWDGGRFRPAGSVTGLTADLREVQVADVDGDSIGDLVIRTSRYGGGDVWVAPGLGAGAFGAAGVARYDVGGAVATGDWDGDGDVDLVFGEEGRAGFAVRVAANDGRGAFGRPATVARFAGSLARLSVADLEGDGAVEAFAETTGVGGGVHRIDPDGATEAVVPGVADAHLVDLDGDGDLDLFAGAPTAAVAWNEAGQLGPTVAVSPRRLEAPWFVDANGDGVLDVIGTSGVRWVALVR